MILFDEFLQMINKDDEGNPKTRIKVLKNGRWWIPAAAKYITGGKFNPKVGAHRGLLKSMVINEINPFEVDGVDWSNLQMPENQSNTEMGHVWPKDGSSMGQAWPYNILQLYYHTNNNNNKEGIKEKLNTSEEKKTEVVQRLPEANQDKTDPPQTVIHSNLPNPVFVSFPRDKQVEPPNKYFLDGLIELLGMKKGTILKAEELMVYWRNFRSEVKEDKKYTGIEDLYRHFRNWILKQDVSKQKIVVDKSGVQTLQPKISVK